MTTTPGKATRATRAEDLSAGTTKHFPDPKQKLAFNGASYTVAEVTGNLAKIPALRQATEQAQAAAHGAVADEKAQLPALIVFMAAYIAFVKATFGNSPTTLADFAISPKKARTPSTPEQKAAAKAKRLATRKARGTVGPVKKKSIKGNVVGVVVMPVTAPEAAPPTPTGAPSPAPVPTPAPAPATGTGATSHS
jgi:hypothetical protein